MDISMNGVLTLCAVSYVYQIIIVTVLGAGEKGD